jgi:hypothetical protein
MRIAFSSHSASLVPQNKITIQGKGKLMSLSNAFNTIHQRRGLLFAASLAWALGSLCLAFPGGADAAKPVKILIAPIYYDINTKDVEKELKAGTLKYLKRAVDNYQRLNPKAEIFIILDPEELGYKLWKEHDFDGMGYSRPKKERIKAAGIAAGSDVVITLSIHHQMGVGVSDTFAYVQAFAYDLNDDSLRDYDEEHRSEPVATVYYSVEDLVKQALMELGATPETSEPESGGPASSSER